MCSLVGGVKVWRGATLLDMKIYNIKKKVVFCGGKKDFDFDLLLGLDVIKAFRLRQDERLTILQAQINKKKSEGNRAIAEHEKDELIKLEVISDKPTKKITINWISCTFLSSLLFRLGAIA